jgi:hypothetical protein
MQRSRIAAIAMCGLILAVGCRHTNTVNKAAFKSALDNYYAARQECVWPSPIKLPAQVDTSDDMQTKGYDAMTDAGLLKRTPEEKKRFLIGSKQVNDYDLSDKGRSVWTADQTQPGYGNFCYGHYSVSSINSYSPSDNPNATSYSVTYNYKVDSLPDWAKSAEVQTAFPKIASDANGSGMAMANLTQSTNGWQVGSVQPAGGSSSLPQ